jgi:membrane associated rhomboid family serine protease
MIPLSDDNPTRRRPVVTIALLAVMAAVWVLVQGAGFHPVSLAASVCNWGMVAGELTGRARLGAAVPVGQGMRCIVDAEPRNILTPITAMFLHGGWAHILGNGLFLWIFGDNVEDSMGRVRFLVFYLLCGLAAAAAQIAVTPASPVPMVGASGAIAGVLGGYLLLYPRARVRMLVFLLFFVQIITFPAWMILIWWIGLQVLGGLPQLTSLRPDVSAGVAFWAHVGGFGAGPRPRASVRERRFSTPRRHENAGLSQTGSSLDRWARARP